MAKSFYLVQCKQYVVKGNTEKFAGWQIMTSRDFHGGHSDQAEVFQTYSKAKAAIKKRRANEDPQFGGSKLSDYCIMRCVMVKKTKVRKIKKV